MRSPETQLPERFVLFWDQKFVQFLGGRPWGAALLVAVALFSSFYVLASATGIYALMDKGSIPDLALTFGLDPYTWAAFVTSLLTGFAISASSLAIVNEERDLKLAAPVLGYAPDDLADEWLSFQKAQLGWGQVAAVGFFISGLVVAVFNIPGAADVLGLNGGVALPWFQQVLAAWFLCFVPLNFAILGKSAFFTVSDERFMLDLRVKHLNIDLFHPEKLAPFTRMALRRCFLWSIGSAIGLLFFLNAAIELSGLAPFLAAIVAVAFAALFVPLTGIHRKIVAVKMRELGEVRDLIVELKGQLMKASAGGDVAQRLTGLIAYEARLEKAPEWPIDLPTIGKFSLYLGIPVFSWVGGALMERLMDAFI